MKNNCLYKEVCPGCCLDCKDYKEVSIEEMHRHYEEMVSRGFGALHD